MALFVVDGQIIDYPNDGESYVVDGGVIQADEPAAGGGSTHHLHLPLLGVG